MKNVVTAISLINYVVALLYCLFIISNVITFHFSMILIPSCIHIIHRFLWINLSTMKKNFFFTTVLLLRDLDCRNDSKKMV
jgi:hypothetical protein